MVTALATTDTDDDNDGVTDPSMHFVGFIRVLDTMVMGLETTQIRMTIMMATDSSGSH